MNHPSWKCPIRRKERTTDQQDAGRTSMVIKLHIWKRGVGTMSTSVGIRYGPCCHHSCSGILNASHFSPLELGFLTFFTGLRNHNITDDYRVPIMYQAYSKCLTHIISFNLHKDLMKHRILQMRKLRHREVK